ncbi:hypothetical protein DCCM_3055 [Desulfocucumis palustris]|uniref:Uncharacterized protein n=1 Tax=Desulfocucumis palustris TaxID=1898651 RepID=A0A2L2XD59_9FIRM|nr:hypothetical protein [Desulfocucumis palustris]GBF33944.1 hypothetical protein DCCM_3055 [Desulfocucumis palustris]
MQNHNSVTAPVKEQNPVEKTLLNTLTDDMKTIVLWIYNINQNGAANTFCEDMSRYFTPGRNGNTLIKDMSRDKLSEFLESISTAKEITLPDMNIRLILLIYNCNQNGVNNTAKVSCDDGLPKTDNSQLP